ncbi:hypothetical protein BDR26DRAFT_936805 [Obelidium mucronatum]|nr:hypothetical protein BDR26DRAFT_552435 [Obelidium mucronatum]KAI9334714.1 hypothetical protein BDR26DRAFT_552460 [Obelidium mucronatum]KAI9334717.1 hypothetical protein BDR26DRAFT_936805 [Obelidium mucronatum]
MTDISTYHTGLTLSMIPVVYMASTPYLFIPLAILIYALTAVVIVSQSQEMIYIGSLIKVLCVLPLGLGSLILFQLLPVLVQRKWFGVFSMYINWAVLGNVAMMFFVPASDTWREWGCRFACICLTVSLWKQVTSDKWDTFLFENGFFVFTAVSLDWILTHACYRSVLITLPVFDTQRHFSMEFLSLGTMVLLWLIARVRNGSTRSLENFFGQADTLVVATICAFTSIYDIVNQQATSNGREGIVAEGWNIVISQEADVVLTLIAFLAGCHTLHTTFRPNEAKGIRI